MSLLTICQNAAEEIGLNKPSTIIGNTNATAVRLLRHATRTGAVMAKKNWHELIKTVTFSTADGEPQQALPALTAATSAWIGSSMIYSNYLT